LPSSSSLALVAPPDDSVRPRPSVSIDLSPEVLGVLILTRPGAVDPDWLNALETRVCEAILAQPVAPDVTTRVIGPQDSTRLSAGDLSMDLDQLRVSVSGREVTLTHQEFLLLEAFMRNPGRVLSRGQLLAQAWPARPDGEGRTVDVHVRRLRVKLGVTVPQIVTVRGFGYRFEP
jgi:DNA-binding response OmpR family regulator